MVAKEVVAEVVVVIMEEEGALSWSSSAPRHRGGARNLLTQAHGHCRVLAIGAVVIPYLAPHQSMMLVLGGAH